MDHSFLYLILVVLGLCMGSFAGATVWRLRAHQLIGDKALGEHVDSKEFKTLLPLTKVTFTNDRSRCLHCEHELAWYDLLPLISWLSTSGRCRYCKVSIGKFEPIIEIGTAFFFVASFALWPEALNTALQISEFVTWLISGVLLAMLFAYDLKWFLLPNQLVFTLMGLGATMAILNMLSAPSILQSLLNLTLGAAILSGLYLILWYISKGRWIGFGDVKLGFALALLLGNWQLAFIALFSANLIGCVIVIPSLLLGKMTRTTHVPFGPLLITGSVIAMLVGQPVVEWYVNTLI